MEPGEQTIEPRLLQVLVAGTHAQEGIVRASSSLGRQAARDCVGPTMMMAQKRGRAVRRGGVGAHQRACFFGRIRSTWGCMRIHIDPPVPVPLRVEELSRLRLRRKADGALRCNCFDQSNRPTTPSVEPDNQIALPVVVGRSVGQRGGPMFAMMFSPSTGVECGRHPPGRTDLTGLFWTKHVRT